MGRLTLEAVRRELIRQRNSTLGSGEGRQGRLWLEEKVSRSTLIVKSMTGAY